MSDIAIKVENLSKQYRLGTVGTGTLRHDLNRLWHTLRGKEDPYLKIGQVNDRVKKAESDYVWALQDINFEVKQGEVLGIIGRNGAGKSTLLKILSKITAPNTGQITINGRIASLLEVGTGFHPELSGRDNIFLNGAILGMKKWEIQKKFDEIVDFSGVEAYIDTPVKRYSSGMYVRLAFAVAAFLEPEILIIDEVLAVGDAEFQKKCLGRMNEVSKNDGRTILFVSHNLSVVRQLCSKGILLRNGQLVFQGSASETIDCYIEKNNSGDNLTSIYIKQKLENKNFELIKAEVLDSNLCPKSEFELFEEIIVRVTVNCVKSIPNLYGYVSVKNKQEEMIIESDTFDYLPNLLDNVGEGVHEYYLTIDRTVLAQGAYIFNISFASHHSNNFLVDAPEDILAFSVTDNITRRGARRTSKTGYLIKWGKEYAKR
jgi:lipopolysaccharide transport system ATP-binding protein